MNNMFLYAARDSEAYREVERYLTDLSFNGKLIVLPPGSQFTSPLCLELRSNDLFIIFAEDDEAVKQLLDLRDEYECFRIILIMKNEIQAKNSNFTLLSPRFISYLENKLDDVSEYIENIFIKQ